MKVRVKTSQNINEIALGPLRYAVGTATGSAIRRLANRRRRISVLVTLILVLGSIGVLYFSRSVSAATRVWDGGGVTNNWSEAANWSGDTVPAPADIAIFDGTSTKDVTIDAAGPQGANINIGAIQINPGYAGTITQAPAVNITLAGASNFAFSQNEPLSTFIGSSGSITANNPFLASNGSFAGGNGDIDLNFRFTLSGGSFTSTSGRLFVAGDFIHTAGGSFLHNNGTVIFDVFNAIIDVSGSETFNDLTFNAVNGAKNIAAGDTLIAMGTLTLADGFISDAGTVEARADVIHQATFDGGSGNIRIAQPTTRTITLAAGGKLPNLTLNAANVTIDTTGVGTFTFSSLNLQAGTVEQGSVAFNLSGSFTQSGGTYTSGSSALTISNSFTLSGGSFSQASGLLRVTNPFTMSNGTFTGGSADIDLNNGFILSGGGFTSTSGSLFVASNFTHTAGGSFLHNNGTVIFDGFNASIDVSGSETFNDLTFNAVNGAKNIAAGDTLIAMGTLTLTDGFINTGTLSPRGNMTVANSFDGGNALVTFSGAEAQSFTNNGGPNPTGIWTVNKSAGKVTLASNLTLGTSQTLNITSGTLDLGASFNLTAGPITIGASGNLRNFGNGNLTLGGNLVNNGIFNFNGGSTGCSDANAGDPLLIRSSLSGTPRNWSGTGEFSIVDVDVQDQNASALPIGLRAFTSTNSGNNANWIFDTGCPVEISAQPTDQGGCLGDLTTFTVSATGDSLTFQWRKNAVELVDGGNISGATTPMLNINPTTAADVGPYDMVATNRFGVTAVSTAANLTLLAPPMIISQPVSTIHCETEPVTFTVGATGDGLTYQWRKDENPILGATASSFSINSVAASDAGNYDVVVGGTCSPSVISSVATLTMNTAPVITSQPASQQFCEDSSASFSVTATGSDLTFQWRRNGMPLSDEGKISGANTATLTIDPVVADDSDTYDVVVAGTCSPQAISDSVSLTVKGCSSAGLITFEGIPSVTSMTDFNDTPVPLNARLSTQLQTSHGVSFSSIAGYVAVVNLGSGHATSSPNGIGGVDASNPLKYNSPVVITFSLPGSPSTPAITDFVSIRGDRIPAAGSAEMEAFDISGALIGNVTAPDTSGGLTLSLSIPNIHSVRLTQTQGDIAYDDLRFNPLAPGLSARPTANAGPDQPIHAGQSVILDGSGSSDDNTATENLVFAWTLTSKPEGSAATLVNSDSMSPSFVTDMPGEYVANLIVTDADSLSSDPDIVVVSSLNTAPVADAGVDRGVFVGQAVTLDGSASYDPDSDPVEFSWMLTAPDGSEASLLGERTRYPTFTPSVAGTYTATLRVNDPYSGVAVDSVLICAISTGQFTADRIASALNLIGGLTLDQVTTKGNRQALQNLLTQALAALAAGDLDEARSKLMQAIERTDGCVLRGSPDGNGSGRDWVIDCAAQASLHETLTAALNALMQ